MADVIDITRPVHPGMEVYPGDPPVRVERVESMDDGAAANVSVVELSAHAGTHVDAPVHFLADGGGVETLPLAALVGPAEVVEIGGAPVDAAALERVPAGTSRVLLKTGGAAELTTAAAAELVRRGVALVGIDGLTIGDDAVHRALLAAGIVIVESLELAAVEPGAYGLLCLPLKLVGSDGAPARALLVSGDPGAAA